MLRDLCKTFVTAFAVGFSGAVTPGPLLLVCAHQTLTDGFGAGMTAIVGHAAAELVIVVLLLAGLARFLKEHPRTFRLVKGVAGLVLLILGAMILWSVPSATFDVAPQENAGSGATLPLLMGAAVSVGNPYFILWWATVGLTLLGQAAHKGRVFVPTFYVGHVLSDFVWFAFIAASLAIGRTTVLGTASYRILLVASGLFMAAFGAYFALKRERKNMETTEQPSPPRKPFPWRTVLVLGGAVAALLSLLLVLRECGRVMDKGRDLTGDAFSSLADAFKPTVQGRTIIVGEIARIQEKRKLVVLQAEVNVMIIKEQQVLFPALGLTVPGGRTEVRLIAPGNRVQFFLPLARFSEQDFEYRPREKKLVVTFPAPVLDEEFIDVQSDPAKIEIWSQSGVVGSLFKLGGRLTAEARAELRREVLRKASASLRLHDDARQSADKAIRELLGGLAASLREGVQLEVRLADKAEAEKAE